MWYIQQITVLAEVLFKHFKILSNDQNILECRGAHSQPDISRSNARDILQIPCSIFNFGFVCLFFSLFFPGSLSSFELTIFFFFCFFFSFQKTLYYWLFEGCLCCRQQSSLFSLNSNISAFYTTTWYLYLFDSLSINSYFKTCLLSSLIFKIKFLKQL